MHRPADEPRRGWPIWVVASLATLVGAWLIPRPTSAESVDLAPLKQSVVADYAALVDASYQDAVAGARTLAESVDAFLDRPGPDSLARARQAWIDARVPYTQTEAFRFCDGPIDAVEGLINAWPIDEAYVDYVADRPQAGLINDAADFPMRNPIWWKTPHIAIHLSTTNTR